MAKHHSRHTSLTVGATDFDGCEVVQKLLEVTRAEVGPPRVVGGVMEPGKTQGTGNIRGPIIPKPLTTLSNMLQETSGQQNTLKKQKPRATVADIFLLNHNRLSQTPGHQASNLSLYGFTANCSKTGLRQ